MFNGQTFAKIWKMQKDKIRKGERLGSQPFFEDPRKKLPKETPKKKKKTKKKK